ncbi:GNAT family N-acetyltransferase [Paenarthrobacter sp. NPDC092416]|uniref:GNAT family N-acetyltransferase n=1 Tax=Paenarthrobacter sp. NPDC092416 TaxID=3364386 RepID=UPI0037F59AF9
MAPTSNASANGGLTIQQIPVPKRPDAGGSPDFLAFHKLRHAYELEVWGNLDRAATLPEAVLFWQGNDYEERQVFLARLEGKVVGSGSLMLPLSENLTTAGMDVLVDADYRRRGFGTQILEYLERVARERDRNSFDGYCGGPIAPVLAGVPVLEAKSGTGGVPLDNASTRFAVHHGYSLEQVETSSLLSLPVDEAHLVELEVQALRKATAYSLIEWTDRCPDKLVGAFADLKSLMSTEVPIAGLNWEGERWDNARVRQEESTWQASGIEFIVAVARHDASGELAAYTVLSHREAMPGIVNQEDTLVAPEHRGHGLGMIVKIANLRRAAALWPEAKSVMTWNASENRHMLAINIALGFRPSGFEGEWQKRLG